MTKKSLFILLVLIFMFSCILSGCEKTDEVAISSNDIPISNEEQTVDTPSTIQSPSFQKISPDYQAEYIKYDSPYHGLYDDIKRFPDYKFSDKSKKRRTFYDTLHKTGVMG